MSHKCCQAAGHSMRHYAAWAAQRLSLQEPTVVIEETDKFNRQIVHDIFDEHWVVQTRVVCPTELGWCGRRPRLWAVLVHRAFVVETYSSLDNLIRLFSRTCSCSFEVLFEDATQSELDEELSWALKRKTCPAKGKELQV